MNDLEQLLASIGNELRYPPTPEIAPAVAERLRTKRAPRGLATRRTLFGAAAALLLLAGGAIAAAPGTRDAVLQWLGLRGVNVVRVPKLPPLPPESAGADLDLGRRTTLAAARSRVRFPVLVPSLRGAEIYISPMPAGGRIIFAYSPGPRLPRAIGTHAGMLITEFRGVQPVELIRKIAEPGTTIQRTSVRGEPAVWIAGHPHEVVYLDAQGIPRVDTLRLAGNTLLWRHGQILVRIEAHISRDAAIRIARAMHPAQPGD
jgi:hypothetical protein